MTLWLADADGDWAGAEDAGVDESVWVNVDASSGEMVSVATVMSIVVVSSTMTVST